MVTAHRGNMGRLGVVKWEGLSEGYTPYRRYATPTGSQATGERVGKGNCWLARSGERPAELVWCTVGG